MVRNSNTFLASRSQAPENLQQAPFCILAPEMQIGHMEVVSGLRVQPRASTLESIEEYVFKITPDESLNIVGFIPSLWVYRVLIYIYNIDNMIIILYII